MLGLVILAGALGLGLGVVRRLGVPLTRLEEASLASAIGLVAAPWLLFLTIAALDFDTGLLVGTALLVAMAALLAPWRSRRPPEPAVPTSLLSWLGLGVLFAYLFHATMLHDEPGGIYTGGAGYGDLALHLSLISRFATIDALSLDSPLVAGAPLTYPFLGDFFPACLVRGGWSASTALAVTGWLSIMTALALVQAIALRLFARTAAATIAAWLLVLSGSVVGCWYAIGDFLGNGLPGSVGEMRDYAHDPDRGLLSANLVAQFYVPQRALLCALPVFWAVVWLIQAAVRTADRGEPARRLLFAAAVLTGALPFVHVHTFLIAAGLLGWFAIWRLARRRPGAAQWAATAALAILLATPQLAWQLGNSWSASFGRWDPGWKTPEGGSFWWFWLRNWGVALPLVPVGFIVIRRLARGDFALPFYLALLLVFAIANLYQFQPHDWDNMKLLVYAYMAVALIGAGGLAHWLGGRWWRRGIAVAALIGLTATGALTVARLADRHDQLASDGDRRLAARLRLILPEEALVLTSDAHNHVVPMLTGRRIVMGYRGWLWTHGIDYRPLERDVAAMFRGEADAEALLRRRGISHVMIGPRERADWAATPEWYRARYTAIYRDAEVEIFDVRQRRRRNGSPGAASASASREAYTPGISTGTGQQPGSASAPPTSSSPASVAMSR